MESAFRLTHQRRLSLLAPTLIFATLLVACAFAFSTLSVPALSFELASLMPHDTLSGLVSAGHILR